MRVLEGFMEKYVCVCPVGQSIASLRAVSHLQLCPSADSAQNVLDAGKKPIKEIPLAPCPQPLILASLQNSLLSTVPVQ